MNITALIHSTRPSFLLITPICVWLGQAVAYAEGAGMQSGLLVLIVLGATLAHISVNTLNEYEDFKSGLDFQTFKTPFSGGSGTLPNHPNIAPYTLWLGLLSLAATIGIGLYFVVMSHAAILPIGVLGVLVVISYTRVINQHPWLCLIAPGLATGPLMVTGTYLMLTGHYNWLVALLSLVPFFLNNNLLLLNQLPDIEADKKVGRCTFPIAYGIAASMSVYALFALSAYAMIALLIILQILPTLSCIALIPLLFSALAWLGGHTFNPPLAAPRFLWANVLASLLTPLLLTISLLLR